MATLQQLVKKRGVIKGSLTRITNFVKNFDPSKISIDQLRSRRETLLEIKTNFHDVQVEIEVHDDYQLTDSGTNASDEFDNQYHDTMSAIIGIIEGSKRLSNPSTDNTQRPIAAAQIQLPKLDLPVFSGNLKEWSAYRDSFLALIHTNSSLNDTQRMHYLKSTLRGDALNAIGSLTVSAGNYADAWSQLEARFQNKRLIVQEHVCSLINAPVIKKGNSGQLRGLLDNVNNQMAALTVLKIPVKQWDAILIPIIGAKLDFVTKRDWELTLTTEVPTMDEFLKFLEKRCITQMAMSVEFQVNGNNGQKSAFPPNPVRNKAYKTQTALAATGKTGNLDNKSNLCIKCHKTHRIYQCEDFLKMAVNERAAFVRRLNACHNCLRPGHNTLSCFSKNRCPNCGLKHNALLHINENPDTMLIPTSSAQSEKLDPSAPAYSSFCLSELGSQVLLSTAVVLLEGSNRQNVECRCVLDSASEINILSERMYQILGLKSHETAVMVTGVNSTKSHAAKTVRVRITSRVEEYDLWANCVIMPRITENIPNNTFSKENIEIPSHIVLADPGYNVSAPIDLLIGAAHFYTLLKNKRIQIPKSEIYASETHFGYVLGGAVKNVKNCNKNKITCLSRVDDHLQKSIERFWEQEEIIVEPEHKRWSQSEIQCENNFKNSFKRNLATGRFCVQLPFKNREVNLGKSRDGALKRFKNLERKLDKDDYLKADYSNVIHGYMTEGFIELVPKQDIDNENAHYLAHNAVVKNSSSTTRVRVCFDGSAKTSNGLSLNDNLLKGPLLQDDLFTLLVRFRTFRYAMTADISKMYLQVEVSPEQRDLQRFFWRFDQNEPIKIYRFKRVIFGLTSSSFLAIRCLNQIACDIENHQPEVAEAIRKGFYVDDLIYGCDNLKNAEKLQKALTKVLADGGFPLRKWSSNAPQLLPGNTQNISPVVNIEDAGVTSALGLQWNCKTDEFSFNAEAVVAPVKIVPLSKRSILSTVSKCFDPLGLLSPFIIRVKLLMQELWKLKIDWDEPVPDQIGVIFIRFLEEFKQLSTIKIPRHAMAINPIRTELHTFGDSSMKAYGAVSYLRTTDAYGNYCVQMLSSKSRVAPLKTVTLPRLELNAAVLAVRLADKVSKTLSTNIDQKHFWTDSTIVYHWISASPSGWQVYVANRVQEIQNSTEICQWGVVRSHQNAADLVSRGITLEQMRNDPMWFHGPEFLSKPKEQWPEYNMKHHVIKDMPEKRNVKALITNVEPEWPVLQRFSKISRLTRVVAYCLRFARNFIVKKNRADDRVTGPLQLSEKEEAHDFIMREVQKRDFSDEIKSLNENKPINARSKLISLDPFLDSNKILRVGGRIRHADCDYNKKFPIILPAKHNITKLLIENEHVAQLHAGPQHILACLREKYWPLSARNEVRKVTRSCVRCFRVKPRASDIPKMGNLPAERLTCIRPFLNVGLDCAGPFQIKQGGKRSTKTVKSYIALFVCLATKAVHIELMTDLTTESFLAALKRFISRRGNLSVIRCDNATNFVGAKNELAKMNQLLQGSDFQEAFENDLSFRHITFKFSPPRAPHFNGLTERLVRSVKLHLKRILGNATLTYEELNTLFIKIEAVLNSRPLVPLSDSPNDFAALTPAHFLLGQSLTAPAEIDLISVQMNRLSRWQRVEQLRQHFWRRFHKEVLAGLQSRQRWKSAATNSIKVGDLVIVREDNLPPLSWKLARVVELFPGDDGAIRVVSLRTATGIFRRAVSKLCPLPLEDEE